MGVVHWPGREPPLPQLALAALLEVDPAGGAAVDVDGYSATRFGSPRDVSMVSRTSRQNASSSGRPSERALVARRFAS